MCCMSCTSMYGVMPCVAVCCRVLQRVLQYMSSTSVYGVLQCGVVCCRVLQKGAVCCGEVQCGAVWCSVLQCMSGTSVDSQTSPRSMHECVHTRVYLQMGMCVYYHTYQWKNEKSCGCCVCVLAYMQVCMHVCIRVCMSVCIYVCDCGCMHAYVYYRVAKTHRIPYLYRSFSAKVTHI